MCLISGASHFRLMDLKKKIARKEKVVGEAIFTGFPIFFVFQRLTQWRVNSLSIEKNSFSIVNLMTIFVSIVPHSFALLLSFY